MMNNGLDNKDVNLLLDKCEALKENLIKLEKENRLLGAQLAKDQEENKKMRQNILANDEKIILLSDSLNIFRKKIEDLNKAIEAVPKIEDLGGKLLALERDLEKFNTEWYDISFMEERYRLDLLCLQLKIKECLNLPAPPNANNFAQYLINLVKATDKSK